MMRICNTFVHDDDDDDAISTFSVMMMRICMFVHDDDDDDDDDDALACIILHHPASLCIVLHRIYLLNLPSTSPTSYLLPLTYLGPASGLCLPPQPVFG